MLAWRLLTALSCLTPPLRITPASGRIQFVSARIQGKRRRLLPYQSWVMIAETKIGRGDQAYDYYLRINPSHVRTSASFIAANLCLCADDRRERRPTHGEAKNSWLTVQPLELCCHQPMDSGNPPFLCRAGR